MYKKTSNNGVIRRLSDNADISAVDENQDYREYLEWVAGGGVILDADQPPSSRIIATQEFRDRFTDQEKSFIVSRQMSGDVNVGMLLLTMQTQPTINLDSQKTIRGLDYLVSLGGDVTAETKARVLA